MENTVSNVLDFSQKTVSDFGGGIVVVKMFADWCGPCKAMNAEFEKIEGVTLGKIDVESGNELVTEFGIRNIPTTLIFKDGEMKHKVAGNNIPQIKSFIAELN